MEEELKGKEETDTAHFLDKRNSLLEEKKREESMRTRWSIGASDAARTYGLLKEKKKDMEKKEKACLLYTSFWGFSSLKPSRSAFIRKTSWEP